MQFDRVFLSYSLSMIPEWRRTLRQAFRSVAPGGRLLVVDFGQQERLPAWFREILFSWLGKFHVSPRGDLQAVLAEIAAQEGGELSFGALFRGYAWRAVIAR